MCYLFFLFVLTAADTSSTFTNIGKLLLHIGRQRGWVCLQVMQGHARADLLAGVRSSAPGGDTPSPSRRRAPRSSMEGRARGPFLLCTAHRQWHSQGSSAGKKEDDSSSFTRLEHGGIIYNIRESL